MTGNRADVSRRGVASGLINGSTFPPRSVHSLSGRFFGGPPLSAARWTGGQPPWLIDLYLHLRGGLQGDTEREKREPLTGEKSVSYCQPQFIVYIYCVHLLYFDLWNLHLHCSGKCLPLSSQLRHWIFDAGNWRLNSRREYAIQGTVVIILKEMVSRDFQALNLFVKNLPLGHWFRTLKYFRKQQRIYHITVQIAKNNTKSLLRGVVDKTEPTLSSITHTT